ncbi:hypothetical protein TNCV_3229991 [Trichonephila clavipes]|nr:hypothetical protein TNCV_3229991 [Trichonephila clavipes]
MFVDFIEKTNLSSRLTVPISVFMTLSTGVHKQMFRSELSHHYDNPPIHEAISADCKLQGAKTYGNGNVTTGLHECENAVWADVTGFTLVHTDRKVNTATIFLRTMFSHLCVFNSLLKISFYTIVHCAILPKFWPCFNGHLSHLISIPFATSEISSRDIFLAPFDQNFVNCGRLLRDRGFIYGFPLSSSRLKESRMSSRKKVFSHDTTEIFLI